MNKLFLIFISLFVFNNCSNQITYSGKIINENNLDNLNFENKENLLNQFGDPSYIDPISNKYFYFSEKKERKSIFSTKINYSYVFVFEFDSNDKLIKSKVYDLKDKKNIKFIEEETPNEVIKRGIIERKFGGVGPQQQLSNSP